MLKNAFFIALFTLTCWGSYQLSFPSNTPPDLYYEGVFMENITQHVDKLTQGPRAVGDYYHDDAQRYLRQQLSSMGWQVSTQKSTAYNPKNRTAAPIRNVIAKKTGSNPEAADLLLMAHYDSAKFSGTGAGDDASGVAVILETLNAFKKTKQTHTNNILVLFSDAEEMGLLGAHAFINEQLNNHNVGLIINLEARGSSGPVMMWPETTGGNQALMAGFAAADVPMPVTTSLHYEIYKMLPNDTDLSPFNQLAEINGFNLAFIDDHFNYHTRLDTLQNLSLNTLAHQVIQLSSLLKHFSNADLSQMHTADSWVYFTLPMVGLISYPVELTWVLLIVFGLLFMAQLLTLNRHHNTTSKTWLQAALPLVMAAALAYGWCGLLLWLIDSLFPATKDIMQGFPYPGHIMMAALMIGAGLVVSSVFGWFKRQQPHTQIQQSALNICLSLLLLLPLFYAMPGSGLLIWPVVLSIILWLISIRAAKLAEQLAPIFALLSFLLLGFLVVNLPIALGVDALPLTAVVLAWILALFLPLISPLKRISHGLLILMLPLGYLAFSLFSHPTISSTHPHPTSLSYLYDVDTQQGHFYNYDVVNSGWNEDLFTAANQPTEMNGFRRQYKQPLRQLAAISPAIELPSIDIKAQRPLRQDNNQTIDLTITAQSNTDILEIYTNQPVTIHQLSIEGRNAILSEPLQIQTDQLLLRYYFNGKKQIQLQLNINSDDVLDWQVQSHALDLLKRSEFNLSARPDHQIPKPFIKSDNTVVVQSFTFGLDQ